MPISTRLNEPSCLIHLDKPKPIVHRAGGMLLQSKKELVIAADLTEEDVFLYYTTT